MRHFLLRKLRYPIKLACHLLEEVQSYAIPEVHNIQGLQYMIPAGRQYLASHLREISIEPFSLREYGIIK